MHVPGIKAVQLWIFRKCYPYVIKKNKKRIHTCEYILFLSESSVLCRAFKSFTSSSSMVRSFSKSENCSSTIERASSSDSALARASSSCRDIRSLPSCNICRSPCKACTCFTRSSTSSFSSLTWVLYKFYGKEKGHSFFIIM